MDTTAVSTPWMKTGFLPQSSPPPGEIREREQAVETAFSTACYAASLTKLLFGQKPVFLVIAVDASTRKEKLVGAALDIFECGRGFTDGR